MVPRKRPLKTCPLAPEPSLAVYSKSSADNSHRPSPKSNSCKSTQTRNDRRGAEEIPLLVRKHPCCGTSYSIMQSLPPPSRAQRWPPFSPPRVAPSPLRSSSSDHSLLSLTSSAVPVSCRGRESESPTHRAEPIPQAPRGSRKVRSMKGKGKGKGKERKRKRKGTSAMKRLVRSTNPQLVRI